MLLFLPSSPWEAGGTERSGSGETRGGTVRGSCQNHVLPTLGGIEDKLRICEADRILKDWGGEEKDAEDEYGGPKGGHVAIGLLKSRECVVVWCAQCCSCCGCCCCGRRRDVLGTTAPQQRPFTSVHGAYRVWEVIDPQSLPWTNLKRRFDIFLI